MQDLGFIKISLLLLIIYIFHTIYYRQHFYIGVSESSLYERILVHICCNIGMLHQSIVEFWVVIQQYGVDV